MVKKTTLNEVGEMLAHVVEHMATKDDVAALRTELKRDIAAVRTELKGDIAEVRKEMATKEDIAGSIPITSRSHSRRSAQLRELA